jgi:Domain of unknown function (DUF4440)
MKICPPSVFVMVTVLTTAACAPARIVRPTPPIASTPTQDVVIRADTLRAEDIADIEIVKGGNEGDLLGARRRHQLLDSLTQQQHRWEQSRPASYRIRVVSISDCLSIDARKGPRMWPRSIVSDTLIVGHELEPLVERYAQRCLLEMRVEDLFRELSGALADSHAYVLDGIQYDPVYGFPRSYAFSSSLLGRGRTFVETFVPEPSATPAGSQAQQRETLIRIEREIAQANFDCDYRYFERVEATEFTFTDAAGKVSDRKEDLAGESSCKKSSAKATIDSADVRLYGTTAVVVARSTIASTSRDGQPVIRRSRFTDVFVWRDGRWQLVAGHSSRLP